VTEPASPPSPKPLRTGRSVALGCGGFLLFYVAAGITAAAIGAGGPFGIVVVVALVVGLVLLVRGADAATRAVLGRMAVGFAIAAVIFGGCIVALSNTSFH
jgi:hypothetical protein